MTTFTKLKTTNKTKQNNKQNNKQQQENIWLEIFNNVDNYFCPSK